MVDQNNFSLEDEETDESQTSDPMKQLRAHARKLEKELKAATGELETLRTFKAEFDGKLKVSSAAQIFEGLGLTEKQAALFLKVNPDVDPTPETAKAFAEEYGFTVEETAESAEEATEGFSPIPTTSGRPAPGKQWEPEEWYKLYNDNPTEAMKVASQGRVKLQSAL